VWGWRQLRLRAHPLRHAHGEITPETRGSSAMARPPP
jgi:hypothetical protein